MKYALLAAAPLAALSIPQGCDICAKDKQEYCELFPDAAACKTPCGFEVRVPPFTHIPHTFSLHHVHTVYMRGAQCTDSHAYSLYGSTCVYLGDLCAWVE